MKWSTWRVDRNNIKLLQKSSGNSNGLVDNMLMSDVQPLVVDCTHDSMTKHGCSFDVAYLSEGEVLVHFAHTKNMPTRASYLMNEKDNKTARLVKPKYGETCHKDIPHATGASVSNSRMVLIDTAATYEIINRMLVEGRLPGCIRDLIKPTSISTANGKTKVNAGIRIKTGP